jgi:glycosyltransferase involved in cell wall biosynthesis
MSRTVGVVLPAYRPDVERLVAFVRALHDHLAPDVVRVELDAPRDGVTDRLDALPVDVAVADRRRGKGAAVTAGFEALDTDVLAFADADGATSAASVVDVVSPVVDGDADLAVGSRRHPDAEVRSHQTVARRYLGDGFAWLARRLLDVRLTDYQCGAKALTADAWADVRGYLYEPGFAWDIELVAVAGALGRRIVEVPVVWTDQPGSTVDPVRTSLGMARGLVIARHRARAISRDPLHTLLDERRERGPALVDLLADRAEE